ncbi:MAG: ABC-2 family transporter protein [bacterium]
MTLSDSKHFLKYYIQRAKASLMQFAEYRANMIMAVLGSYGYTFMMIVFIEVIFSKTQEVAGWGKYEMMMLFSLGQSVFYTFWSFFQPLHTWFSEAIIDGELDLYLTKPINAFLNVVSSDFDLVEMLPSIGLAVAMFVFVWKKLGLVFEPVMLWAIVSTILSCGIMVGLYAVTALAAFWLTDTRDLASIQSSLLSLNQFPLDIFPKSIKAAMLIFPVALISYPQTKLLLEGKLNIYLLLQPVAFIILFLVVRTMWGRGLKRYSSASS